MAPLELALNLRHVWKSQMHQLTTVSNKLSYERFITEDIGAYLNKFKTLDFGGNHKRTSLLPQGMNYC